MQAHAANVKQGIRLQKKGRIIFNFLSKGLSKGDGEKRKPQDQKEVTVSTGRLEWEEEEEGRVRRTVRAAAHMYLEG